MAVTPLRWLLDTNVPSNGSSVRPNAMLPGKRQREVDAYLSGVVAPMPVLPYDEAAAELHTRQRADAERAGRPRPYADGQIAAIAVLHGLTLVTRNMRDFEGIPGLTVEDWLLP